MGRDTGEGWRGLVIGLVGSIGAGKSAVAAALRELGAAIFDADGEVGRLLASPGIATRIGVEFGHEAAPGGVVDRRALASAVFGDPERRRRLEGILHPPVVEAARALVTSPPPAAAAVVIDAPLLFEAGLDALCDEVWFVRAPREIRLERVRSSRGWDGAELARREAAQLPDAVKRERSDREIENDGGLDELASAVRGAFEAAAAGGRDRG